VIFDPEPKTNEADLFGRKDDLKKLESAFAEERIVLLAGPRSVGKTSLLYAALKNVGLPAFVIDCQRIQTKYDFYKQLELLINELYGHKEHRAKYGFSTNEIVGALAAARSSRVVIAFDDAEKLRALEGAGIHILDIIASSYDDPASRNLVYVLVGTDVKSLEDYIYRPRSPLLGRAAKKIELAPFIPQVAKKFLEVGAKNAELEFSSSIIEEAVEVFDGNVGRLTVFGHCAVQHGKMDQTALNKALAITLRSIQFDIDRLASMSPYYIAILNAVALSPEPKWTVIKCQTEELLKHSLNRGTFNVKLRRLVTLGYLTEENDLYRIPDPLVRQAIALHKNHRIREVHPR
jgi:hypothetical protein